EGFTPSGGGCRLLREENRVAVAVVDRGVERGVHDARDVLATGNLGADDALGDRRTGGVEVLRERVRLALVPADHGDILCTLAVGRRRAEARVVGLERDLVARSEECRVGKACK